MTTLDRPHTPTLAVATGDRTFGIYCFACSESAQAYVWPCVNGNQSGLPTQVVDVAKLDEQRAIFNQVAEQATPAIAEAAKLRAELAEVNRSAAYWLHAYEQLLERLGKTEVESGQHLADYHEQVAIVEQLDDELAEAKRTIRAARQFADEIAGHGVSIRDVNQLREMLDRKPPNVAAPSTPDVTPYADGVAS